MTYLYLALKAAFILTASNVFGVFAVTEVKQCKTPPIVPAVFDVKDCETPPCIAKKLSTLHCDVTFTPDQDYEKVIVVLQGQLMGVTTGFPGVDGLDGCNNLYTNPGRVKAGCPLKSGQEYVYSVDLTVLKQFPKVTALTHWALKDKKSKKEVVCGEILVKIV